LRELMPQDLKIEIARLTKDETGAVARYLASVVGRAHARQMDEGTGRNGSVNWAGIDQRAWMRPPGFG